MEENKQRLIKRYSVALAPGILQFNKFTINVNNYKIPAKRKNSIDESNKKYDLSNFENLKNHSVEKKQNPNMNNKNVSSDKRAENPKFKDIVKNMQNFKPQSKEQYTKSKKYEPSLSKAEKNENDVKMGYKVPTLLSMMQAKNKNKHENNENNENVDNNEKEEKEINTKNEENNNINKEVKDERTFKEDKEDEVNEEKKDEEFNKEEEKKDEELKKDEDVNIDEEKKDEEVNKDEEINKEKKDVEKTDEEINEENKDIEKKDEVENEEIPKDNSNEKKEENIEDENENEKENIKDDEEYKNEKRKNSSENEEYKNEKSSESEENKKQNKRNSTESQGKNEGSATPLVTVKVTSSFIKKPYVPSPNKKFEDKKIKPGKFDLNKKRDDSPILSGNSSEKEESSEEITKKKSKKDSKVKFNFSKKNSSNLRGSNSLPKKKSSIKKENPKPKPKPIKVEEESSKEENESSESSISLEKYNKNKKDENQNKFTYSAFNDFFRSSVKKSPSQSSDSESEEKIQKKETVKEEAPEIQVKTTKKFEHGIFDDVPEFQPKNRGLKFIVDEEYEQDIKKISKVPETQAKIIRNYKLTDYQNEEYDFPINENNNINKKVKKVHRKNNSTEINRRKALGKFKTLSGNNYIMTTEPNTTAKKKKTHISLMTENNYQQKKLTQKLTQKISQMKKNNKKSLSASKYLTKQNTKSSSDYEPERNGKSVNKRSIQKKKLGPLIPESKPIKKPAIKKFDLSTKINKSNNICLTERMNKKTKIDYKSIYKKTFNNENNLEKAKRDLKKKLAIVSRSKRDNEKAELIYYNGPIDIRNIALVNYNESTNYLERKVKKSGFSIWKVERNVYKCVKGNKTFIVQIVKINNGFIYYLVNKGSR